MSWKTENVNVAFEMINQAVDEYSGFVLGLPEGDVISQILGKPKEKKDIDDQRAVRKTLSSITDRTNGGLSLSEIESNTDLVKLSGGTTRDDIFTMIHGKGNPFKPSSKELGFEGYSTEDLRDFNDNQMRHVLKYRSIENVSFNPALLTTGSDGSDIRDIVITGRPGSFVLPPPSLNSNLAVKPAQDAGFNKESPSFGTVIIKDTKFGVNARNAGHMPVFLSAVTPLEMSRCLPYLDVKVITKKGNRKSNKLGIYNFIRSSDTEKENINNTFFNPRPGLGSDIEGVVQDSFYNYMDLFTSPQTMVNADINKNRGQDFLKDSFNFDFENLEINKLTDFEFTNVKDPFQPLMTLLGFSVSISGIGHGLLASKKATLKIKLHDKSRIKDLESLLSPTLFASTKFIIEFGWSHPDGAVDSTNTIGKYLNALRDTGVYQLVNADYSFGNDSSVDINLNLACSGFQQMKSISAAGGVYTGLDAIIDDLEEVVNDLLNEKLPGDKKRGKIKRDIRGQLKISHSDLSKNSNLVLFEQVSKLRNKSNEIQEKPDIGAQKDFIKELLTLLYGSNVPDLDAYVNSVIKNAELNKDQSAALTISQEKKELPAEIIYGKFEALKEGIDPFRFQTCSKYFKENIKKYYSDSSAVKMIGIDGTYGSDKRSHVSLGKIISLFVGYPMATSYLYDEVQVFFYPVNPQSAAARRHTTASFPIKISDLRAELDKRIKAGESAFRDMSVHSFFSMLERLVSSQKCTAYGLFGGNGNNVDSSSKKLEDFQKKKREEKLAEANGALEPDAIAAIIENIEKKLDETNTGSKDRQVLIDNEIISSYESKLGKELKSNIDGRLKSCYKGDGMGGQNVDEGKFIPVNLSMYFESFPVKAESPSSKTDGFFGSIASFFKSSTDRRSIEDNGIIYDKNILRIHIYDENTSTDPNLSIYGTDFNFTPQAPQDPPIDPKKYSYPLLKNILMNAHPTIIHGAASGVVNSISLSSNTSGTLSNILMVESYGEMLNDEDNANVEAFDQTVLLPSTIQLELMGFPGLSRGQQIFIDFGTQTSLDNLYVVKTVDHSVSQGSFKTSAVLVASNQMVINSFRSKVESLFTSS